MLRRNVILGFTAGLLAVICVAALILAGSDDTRVASAAMKGDKEAVRSLLKQAADVNAAQGDGNLHNHKRVGLFLAGHAGGSLKGGLHVRATDGTPSANVYLTLLHKLGMDDITVFGDSTGELPL